MAAKQPTARQAARNEIKASLEMSLLRAKQDLHIGKYNLKQMNEKQEVLKRKVNEVWMLLKTMENV